MSTPSQSVLPPLRDFLVSASWLPDFSLLMSVSYNGTFPLQSLLPFCISEFPRKERGNIVRYLISDPGNLMILKFSQGWKTRKIKTKISSSCPHLEDPVLLGAPFAYFSLPLSDF